MSPRPRTVHDDAILDAAVQVLSRIGPEKMTLADVGGEVGLSAATLVQRFGSKRELMLSVLKYAMLDLDTRFEASVASNESPLDALFAVATERPGGSAGNVSLSNRLSFYLLQIEDPEFREVALANSQRAIAGFKRLLDASIEANELAVVYTDTAQLAETIYSMMVGAMVTWSVANEGAFKSKMRRDLDLLLRPFRRGPRKASGSSSDRTSKPAEAMAAQTILA